MVVLLIIGILVAIAVPVYTKSQANAKLRACQANLRTIDGAIAQYQADNGTDPADVDALVTAGYLKAVPECPEEPNGDGDDYDLEGSGAGLHAICTVDSTHKYP
jgi:type IV pilus assembly protein PilA